MHKSCFYSYIELLFGLFYEVALNRIFVICYCWWKTGITDCFWNKTKMIAVKWMIPVKLLLGVYKMCRLI